MRHPYEDIEVDYRIPERPEHLVEYRYVPTHPNNPESITTERHLFIDGVDANDYDAEGGMGWGRLCQLEDQTKAWKSRESYGNRERYDAIQIARLRRIKAFGEPKGSPSNNTAKFEGWLMDRGWRPVMLDALNAHSPGRVLCGKRIADDAYEGSSLSFHLTHVFFDGEHSISMQFGLGNFNFVFEHTKHPGKVFQVPVNENEFEACVNGSGPDLWGLLPRNPIKIR